MNRTHDIRWGTACALVAIMAITGYSAPPSAHTVDLSVLNFPDGHLYNIYTDSRPITLDNFKLARRLCARRDATAPPYTYQATYSGDHYFLVTTCDPWGQENIAFNSNRASGPFVLTDRTAPTAISIELAYVDGNAVLTWPIPRLENPENIRAYRIYRATSPTELVRRDTLLDNVSRPMFDGNASYALPNPGSGDAIFYYAVTAVDSAGNESILSNVARSAQRPDLAIASADYIRDNPDLSISKLYPVKGEEVSFSARIRNQGPLSTGRFNGRARITDFDGNMVAEHTITVEHLAAGDHHDFPFTFIPEQAGEHRLDIELDSGLSVREICETNNSSSLTFHVVEKDIYFLWYGDPRHLKHINVTQTNPRHFSEWERRGVIAGGFAGVHGNTRPQYFGMAERGYGGVLVDEIGGLGEDEKALLAILPELKKAYPDFLVAIWLAAGIHQELADAVKAGHIDLLMPELYISCRPGDHYKERIRRTIESARKFGVLDKTIIGLGSADRYANYTSADMHTDFLEAQIRFIREEAPEMPGIAFFTAGTLPGVDAKLDEMCFKYFIQPQGK